MGYSFAPFWCLCQKLSLSPLYFNKTLLHKSSERSSLVSVPGLNSSPPEAKNPGVLSFSKNLSLNIQKTKIMASGPITSRQIGGERVETVADFIFLGSKVTGGGECSHEIKRHLLLGRKVMTNLDSVLKSRDINWHVNKGQSSQGYGFSSSHV